MCTAPSSSSSARVSPPPTGTCRVGSGASAGGAAGCAAASHSSITSVASASSYMGGKSCPVAARPGSAEARLRASRLRRSSLAGCSRGSRLRVGQTRSVPAIAVAARAADGVAAALVVAAVCPRSARHRLRRLRPQPVLGTLGTLGVVKHSAGASGRLAATSGLEGASSAATAAGEAAAAAAAAASAPAGGISSSAAGAGVEGGAWVREEGDTTPCAPRSLRSRVAWAALCARQLRQGQPREVTRARGRLWRAPP